jgi:O2-independent ubiquinone biosynthesis accessory factor UbiT
MSSPSNTIPQLPPALRILARPLPLPVLALVMNRLARQMVQRHPSLFARLGEHTTKCFQIDPVDLPFVFHVFPMPDAPRITLHRRGRAGSWDGRIAGSLAALIGMIHGAYDGDALFFSRDIVLEGDTAAVLALRNAIDDSELDLFEEFLAALGPLGRFVKPGMQPLLGQLQKRTGVALRRAEFTS